MFTPLLMDPHHLIGFLGALNVLTATFAFFWTIAPEWEETPFKQP